MANRRIKGNTYRGALIDTAPGTAGYYSEAVNAREHFVGKMHLSICGIFSATVTLQFRRPELNTWTVYDTYTDVAREIIEDYSDTEWRVGVASGGYASGTARVAIDYFNGESK